MLAFIVLFCFFCFMNLNTPHFFKLLRLICVGLLSTFPPSQAALLLEADYSVGLNLTVGSPSAGTLTGNATVSDGALQIDTNAASGATYGGVTNYLDVSNTSWGSNTIVTTFSLNAVPNSRQTLMSTSQDNANGIILFANHDNATRGPRIDFHRNSVGQLVRMDNSKPLANTDYFLAVSWLDNEDGTLSIQMYFRQLDDLVGTSALYQTFTMTNPSGTNGMANSGSQTLSLGHRAPATGYGSNSDPLNGDIYLFQTYNTYTSTESAFNSLYEATVIPEPGTAALLSAAGFLLLMFRRSSKTQL